MWALRRATNPLRNEGCALFRNEGFTTRISRSYCANSEVSSGLISESDTLRSPRAISDRCPKRVYQSTGVPFKLFTGRCSLSTLAGSTSSEDEDKFSELGASADIQEIDAGVKNENDLSFDQELSDDVGNDCDEPFENKLELSNAESDTSKKTKIYELVEAIVAAPHSSIHSTLDKWVAERRELNHKEIFLAMSLLRKRRAFAKTLELSNWLLASTQFDFAEKDYASHLDLIAKVHGLAKAENFIEKIPQSFKGRMIYGALLANYVKAKKEKETEKLFKKMKTLGIPLTAFDYNQMIILYRVLNRKKISDVLLLMEKEKVKPDLVTYQLLLGIKCNEKNTSGVEQIVERMKAEGIELSYRIKTTLAEYYICSGVKEKAEAILKEMEGSDLREKRWACPLLLRLYAKLGKADEVERVWQVCESHPRQSEYLAVIEAWGQLKRVEEAEVAFNEFVKNCKDSRSGHYVELLEVYVTNKMLEKAKLLVKRMSEIGCPIGPLTWDALVRLYVDAGEVEKAESILQKAVEKSKIKPLHRSYISVLRGCALKGDVHNAEKCFESMIDAGYSARHKEFNLLLLSYVRAKIPAYGFKDRMKAHNISPDASLASKLASLDNMGKSQALNLLV